MTSEELHTLLPDLEQSAIARALQQERVRCAVRDLTIAQRKVRTSAAGSPALADWEATRDELLCEIRRLTLKFGMKAPGAGVLEFELEQQPEGCRVTATAYWHPAGVWGLLYWYALIPAHLVIFKGMTEAIAAQAEALQRAEQGAGAG